MKHENSIKVLFLTVMILIIGSFCFGCSCQKSAIPTVEEATKNYEEAHKKVLQAYKDYAISVDEYEAAQKNLHIQEKNYNEAEESQKEANKKGAQLEATGHKDGAALLNLVDTNQLTYDDMTLSQREEFKAYLDECLK